MPQAYASKKAWSKSQYNLTNVRSREDFINLKSDLQAHLD